jgi:isoquinoline 1-oxidoreductase beta subunit
MPVNLSRRALLASSVGLVVGFNLPGCAHVPVVDTTIGLGQPRPGSDHMLNAYVRVATDGTVVLRMGAAEMGQGVYTSLPMILAEELDCDWATVHVESAPADGVYAHSNVDYPGTSQVTGGSLSVRGYWTALREAGAAARAMLVAAAAKRWKVPVSSCTTEFGMVRSGEHVAAYGELAEAASQEKAPSKVALKDPKSFRLLGTSPARVDLPPKVNGAAIFGADPKLDGMVVAAVKHCPHHGGSFVSFDGADARALPGVIDVFKVDDVEAVAVIASTFWAAKQAVERLNVVWDAGNAKGLDSEKVRATLQAALGTGKDVWKEGEGEAPELAASITTTFEVPYLDHAPIETPTALAWVQADRVDVWAPTQGQQFVRMYAARIAKMPASKVFVHTTLLGGGFGRKGFWDFTDMAVRLSKQTGKPVRVVYTREEAFAFGYYRPAVACRLSAKLGRDGLPAEFLGEMASQNIVQAFVPAFLLWMESIVGTVTDGVMHHPYAFGRSTVNYARVELPIPVGWWRSVHGSHNGFFMESFVDQCAHVAKQDPIEYRRKLLVNNPRWLAVLDLAVEKAGAVAEGQSRGVAIFRSFGSIVAEVADVTVTGGVPKVHRVTAAVDCGQTIHPDTIKAQIESGIGHGLSMMLGEEITLVDGAVQQTNFHQYPLLSLAQMPNVSVHIVPSTEPPGGIGEVGLPPLPAAVCNAIFAATGKRIFRLPIGGQLA